MVDKRDNESDRIDKWWIIETMSQIEFDKWWTGGTMSQIEFDKWWTAETMSQIELINGGQERQ